MSFKRNVFFAFTATLLSMQSAVGSDVQAYAGLQFRVQQSFVDLIKDEFFYELPYIVNDVIAPMVPKEIKLFLGFFQIKNIKVSNFVIDTTRAKFTIDEQKRGIMMNWADLKNWNIHFECLYILFWPIEYSFNVDINLKEVLLDNGLSLQANKHTGAPQVNFFNTQVLLGQSSVKFSGDFAIYIIGWLTNFLKFPIQVLVNEFFQPFVNFVLNSIIVPDFLNNGILKMATYYNEKFYDNLVIDATLPQDPIFYNGTMDVFADGALYFEKQGRHFTPPTTPMRFQLDEQNFQFVLSSFSINSLVDSIIETELLQVPVNHHLVAELFGVELTTTLLLPIIPELFYNFGHRNVSLNIKPLAGTAINWSNSAKQTLVQANALAQWIVDEDSMDNKTEVAFESILNLDLALDLNVNATKNINVQIDKLNLNGFNVTKDNIGGGVKSDEANIEFRLASSMAIIEVALNNIISKFGLKLPDFQVIDYTVKFDYQDGAFGTGIMVVHK